MCCVLLVVRCQRSFRCEVHVILLNYLVYEVYTESLVFLNVPVF
jgi:hypothetical protein